MTFTQWLETQVKRDDPIGDLANDVARDERRKPHQNTRNAWRMFLIGSGACPEARGALESAWRAYRRDSRNAD